MNTPYVCVNISGNPDVWWVLAKILVNLIWKIFHMNKLSDFAIIYFQSGPGA